MVPLTTERLQGAPDYCNPALSGDMAGYANTVFPNDIITDFRLTAACIGNVCGDPSFLRAICIWYIKETNCF